MGLRGHSRLNGHSSRCKRVGSWLIILMDSPPRDIIKRTISNRENSLRDELLPDRNTRRTSLEMSTYMSPKRFKPIVHAHRQESKGKAGKAKSSSASLLPFSFVSHQKEEPEQFKSNEKANAFIYLNYDIMDLSYSLISAELSKCLLLLCYSILLIIRYSSLFCLVYITYQTGTENWEWVFCIIITYTIYLIAMIKVSLRPAENKCETVLKLVFDSLETNEVVDYFQIVDFRKLMQSIFHAIIPPELSFLFIVASSRTKRTEIYCMINYIYSSIEAIIYYPFFVIYTSLYFGSTFAQIPQAAYLAVMAGIMLAEAIFFMVTAYLIWYGCKKRGFRHHDHRH